MKKNKEFETKAVAFSFIGIILILLLAGLVKCNAQVTTSNAYWKGDILVVNTAAHYEIKAPDREKQIDTIYTVRRVDISGDDVKLGGLDTCRDKSVAYILFQGHGMIEFKADSIASWEHIYKFKRTKQFSETIYEKLGVVKQIRDTWTTNRTDNSVRYWIEYTHRIADVKCYVNGKLYKQFSPGQFEVANQDIYLFKQYWGINGLKKGFENKISIFVTLEDGSIDTRKDIIQL